MKSSPKFPIKAVSLRTGLSQHVIRVWEKRYGAVVPERTGTNRRLYSEQDILKLNLLRQATDAGHSIGQIAGLQNEQLAELAAGAKSQEPVRDKRDDSTDTDDRYDGFIEACLEATRRLDEQELEQCLIRAAVALSRPQLLSGVIEPFVEKIGDLWQEGSLRIVHEHLASEVLRKYLGGMIENTLIPESSPRLVVTTPSGQLHELGAIISCVIASSAGWRVTYLGPNLPAEEIAAAIEQFGADYLFLSIVYPSNDSRLEGELRRLRKALDSGVIIIVGGRAADSYSATLNKIGAMTVTDTGYLFNLLDSIRLS